MYVKELALELESVINKIKKHMTILKMKNQDWIY